jgi:1,5-anhydro-D-fructose reductase (1,5-anhydro-D-mannitol-forming)
MQPIRWGIVGPGDIARRVMAPAMLAASGARLVAVCGRTIDSAEAFATAFPGPDGAPRAYESEDDFLADPDLDAVYVATPVDRHAPDVLAAIAAGRDVLVEKPLALNVDEAERVVRAADDAGVRLATCFYQRYNTRNQWIHEALAAGRIGRPTAVRINFSGRSPERPGAWRQDPARAGGGSFTDSAVHAVDLLRFLFGEVSEVVAFVDTFAATHGVEDTASALLRLGDRRDGDGSVQGVVTAHWSTEDPSAARTSILEIGGTEGTIVSWPLHDKFSRGTLLVATAAGEEEVHVPERSTHIALLDDFARARAAGEPFPIDGRDGLAAQRVLAAVYESARTGRVLRP